MEGAETADRWRTGATTEGPGDNGAVGVMVPGDGSGVPWRPPPPEAGDWGSVPVPPTSDCGWIGVTGLGVVPMGKEGGARSACRAGVGTAGAGGGGAEAAGTGGADGCRTGLLTVSSCAVLDAASVADASARTFSGSGGEADKGLSGLTSGSRVPGLAAVVDVAAVGLASKVSA